MFKARDISLSFGSRNTSRRTYIEKNVCPLYLTLQSSPAKRRRFSILVHVTEFSGRAQKKHLGAADEIKYDIIVALITNSVKDIKSIKCRYGHSHGYRVPNDRVGGGKRENPSAKLPQAGSESLPQSKNGIYSARRERSIQNIREYSGHRDKPPVPHASQGSGGFYTFGLPDHAVF